MATGAGGGFEKPPATKSKTQGDTILERLKDIAKEHRKNCEGETCDINLFHLGIAAQDILQRKLTAEEWNLFI